STKINAVDAVTKSPLAALRLSALIFLYLLPLKGIFCPDHRDSFLYINFSCTHRVFHQYPTHRKIVKNYKKRRAAGGRAQGRAAGELRCAAARHALMEFRGQQEPVHEEMGTPPAAAVPSRAPPSAAAALSSSAPEVRYHECLRNHAAALGGHVVDGCGEFMPGAGAGDDALKCAACGCHRSFHRKDDGQQQPRRQLLLPAPAPPAAGDAHGRPARPAAHAATAAAPLRRGQPPPPLRAPGTPPLLRLRH
ncbi:hypothetical protein EJB05_18241, partial [Eragrostis curvula]